MSIDILFIHPGNHRKTYQELAGEFTAIAPPVWTTFLAEHVRNHDMSTAIHDTNVSGWDGNIIQKLYGTGGMQPKLTVIMVYGHNPSASTQTMVPALSIIGDIKKFNSEIPIAIGGLHPNALPEETLRLSGSDFLIRGEGGKTITGLFNYLQGKQTLDSVPNLCYLQNQEFCETAMLPPSANLDEDYPANAWDLLPPLSMYRAHNSHTFQYFQQSKTPDFSDVRSPYAVLYTSLGCPFNCSYCCINSLFGKPAVRYWSLPTVFKWLDKLAASGVKQIRLDDELFVLDPKRVEAFCDYVIGQGYDFNFWAYARVDTIQAALLGKMKKAGFNWLCLGIESGNSAVRNSVSKHIHKDIEETVRLIQSNDIYILGNYIFGLPEDTMETMNETLNLSIRLNCEFSNYYSAMPYPGSKLYEEVKKSHPEYLPETLNGYSQHSFDCKPLPTKFLSADEVLKFRDYAFDAFFKNEKYLLMVEKKFGSKCVEHIQKMTSIKLKRKLYK